MDEGQGRSSADGGFTPPHIPGVRLSYLFRPGTEPHLRGRDICDVSVVADGRVLLSFGTALTDTVFGEEMRGRTMEAIRSSVREEEHPQLALARAGGVLFHPLHRHATMLDLFLGLLDVEERTLRYAVAGDCSPLLLSREHSAYYLPGTGSNPLGIDPGSEYGLRRLHLGGEDRLIFCSPGAVLVPYRRRVLGGRGLRRLVNKCSRAAVEELSGAVMEALDGLAGGEHPGDITLLAVQTAGS